MVNYMYRSQYRPKIPNQNVRNFFINGKQPRAKETFRISRSTFLFLLGRIPNAVEKDTITEELISPEARFRCRRRHGIVVSLLSAGERRYTY